MVWIITLGVDMVAALLVRWWLAIGKIHTDQDDLGEAHIVGNLHINIGHRLAAIKLWCWSNIELRDRVGCRVTLVVERCVHVEDIADIAGVKLFCVLFRQYLGYAFVGVDVLHVFFKDEIILDNIIGWAEAVGPRHQKN